MNVWKCTVCGYLHEGKQPPEECPVCGAIGYRFILNVSPSEPLLAALKFAFGAESKAMVRNLAYAKKADTEGYADVARLFRAVAEAERVHAQEYLKYFELVTTDTEENLKRAFESEMKAHQEGYAPLIRKALEEKREDVVWSFSRARDVEDHHAKLYKQALSALAAGRDMDYQVCQVCGYVFDGALPDECPICKAKPSNFHRVA
jgi:rubrerythrin